MRERGRGRFGLVRWRLKEPSGFLDEDVFGRSEGEQAFMIKESWTVFPGWKVGTIAIQAFGGVMTNGAVDTRVVRRIATVDRARLAFTGFANVAKTETRVAEAGVRNKGINFSFDLIDHDVVREYLPGKSDFDCCGENNRGFAIVDNFTIVAFERKNFNAVSDFNMMF